MAHCQHDSRCFCWVGLEATEWHQPVKRYVDAAISDGVVRVIVREVFVIARALACPGVGSNRRDWAWKRWGSSYVAHDGNATLNAWVLSI